MRCILLKIHVSSLTTAAYVYLVLPVFIFFAGFLRIPIAIVLCIILCAGLVFAVRLDKKRLGTEVFHLPIKAFIICAVIILLWCIISGQGNLYYQSNDWHWRNAIFRDLINFRWPVIYPNNGTGLVYYIAHWLPAALIGKLLGWNIGNIALLFWTFAGIVLTFLLLCRFAQANSGKRAAVVLTVLILWSGLDILGTLWNTAQSGAFPLHLEWWDHYIQYSSDMTQLMWVFNQVIVPWLATALLLNGAPIQSLGFITLLVFPAAPLPFCGFVPLAAVAVIQKLIPDIKNGQLKAALLKVFSPQNLAALFSIVPVYFLYYTCNSAADGNTSHFTFFGMSVPAVLSIVIPFYFIEFLIYSLIIGKKYLHEPLFIAANILLLIIPFFKIGAAADFVMRSSIPPLFIIMAFTAKFPLDTPRFALRSPRVIALLVVFLIGTATPVVEQIRAVTTIREVGKINAVADGIVTFYGQKPSDFANFLTTDAKDKPFYKYLARKN